MNGANTMQERSSYDMYVSLEAKQLAQPIQKLLTIGLDMGLSTSMTEAQSSAGPSAESLKYRRLAKLVREECAHLSTIREIVTHPAYLQIIGMGPVALPLLLRELEEGTGHWFPALRAIAQEDPVLPRHRGILEEMSRDWLDWGRRKGLRW